MQDQVASFRLTKAIEGFFKDSEAYETHAYSPDPLPCLVRFFLGLFPAVPKGASPEEAEAHVVALKSQLAKSILIFLSRLEEAKYMTDWLRSRIIAVVGFLFRKHKADFQSSDTLEIPEDTGVENCKKLGRYPLLDLVSLYAFIANYIGSRSLAPALLPDFKVRKEKDCF